MIIAGNYELNFDYFPFTGIGEKSFYANTSVDGIIFENQPPRADFSKYFKNTGIQIDYVLLIGLNPNNQYFNHEYTSEIKKQLVENYYEVYASPNKVAILYKNKSTFINPWKK